MNLRTSIVIKFAVEGLHSWPNAKEVFPEVGFLSDLHRHLFNIEMKCEVFHDDRDKEFFVETHKVKKFLNQRYYSTVYQCLNFGPMSCEMIAKDLLINFDCLSVSVFEDQENGATIEKI